MNDLLEFLIQERDGLNQEIEVLQGGKCCARPLRSSATESSRSVNISGREKKHCTRSDQQKEAVSTRMKKYLNTRRKTKKGN